MNIYAQRIESLRLEMTNNHIDAYLILTSDPHLSEYLPDFWKSRAWLSGFSGSAGSILITKDYAGLWTDGRYWLQAERELQGTSIELQKQHTHNTYMQWLEKNLTSNQVLATDFRVIPLVIARDLQSVLKHKGIALLHADLITNLWEDRPTLPMSPIYEHVLSPHNRKEKLDWIRNKMQHNKITHCFLTMLDDIAWICNLRGSDVPYNPVFLAYLLLSYNEAILFVETSKIPSDIAASLKKDGIDIKPYHQIEEYLENLRDSIILLDPSKTTLHLANIIVKNNCIFEGSNPSEILKSCKSEPEIEHIKEAMCQDGVALCNFFAWLEESIEAKQKVSELDISQQLTYFRSKSPYYISDSFATIAGFNANGAQPHYSATARQFSYIQGNGLLLIDSGGQYTLGTTDITRVVPIGEPTSEQKRDYTLVLKAHIALASAIFPANIPMPFLDSLTRVILWKEQINYMHGTGHGVGYFLNVHEGPQVISYFAPPLLKTQAKVGMVSSIEPGIYRAGRWGVRLENLVVSKRVEQPKEKEFGEFLYFETLTLCPFETSCIDATLLHAEEKIWLNQYHNKVLKELENRVEGRAKIWLQKKALQIL